MSSGIDELRDSIRWYCSDGHRQDIGPLEDLEGDYALTVAADIIRDKQLELDEFRKALKELIGE